jgi:hypothetical protein
MEPLLFSNAVLDAALAAAMGGIVAVLLAWWPIYRAGYRAARKELDLGEISLDEDELLDSTGGAS